MADLSHLQASQSVKLAGANASGVETAFANVAANGSLQVYQNEDVNYIAATLTTTATTADQVIIQYTVPVGKTFYLRGFLVSSNNAAGSPVKVGRNALTVMPVSPGTLNGEYYKHFYLPEFGSRDFTVPGSPVAIGVAGDLIKIVVTPEKAATTLWRASIDFILR